MARLCVRITENKHPTDSKLDALRTQPGDVVCVMEDDHKWSPGELKCGQYRFVDLPGVPAAELVYLTEPEFADEKAREDVVAMRVKTLDVTALKTDDPGKPVMQTKAEIQDAELVKADVAEAMNP